MRVSETGFKFIQSHEGNVLTAYLDAVGVATIGYGITNASKIGTAGLKAAGIPNGKIVAGKSKITAAQSESIFRTVLESEYAPYVTTFLKKTGINATQNQYDAMVSAVYNLGPYFLEWNWASLYKKGDIKGAAAYWSSHYNTGGGKKLAGLVRRRKEEAEMFLGKDGVGTPISTTMNLEAPVLGDPVVAEAQENMNKIGIPIEVDGWYGNQTRLAVIRYQKMHPDLKADGVLGIATLTQLRKDAMSIKDVFIKAGSTAALAAGATGASGYNLGWIWIAAIAVGAVATVIFAYRYRDVVKRKFNDWMHQVDSSKR